MNENIDLVEILKYCPLGTEFYSPICGNILLSYVGHEHNIKYPIELKAGVGNFIAVMSNGKCDDNGEIMLFPSKEQRDWSKFEIPKQKKERFDPKTLKPFDKVITRNGICSWSVDFFSHYDELYNSYKCVGWNHTVIVPYNDETKHLVGTNEEAPEFYRYWED